VTTALHHPDLVPALIVAICVVAGVWLAAALSGWRRITWREHMDAPVSLLPRQARRGEGWAEGRVLTRQQEEVAKPSLVLLRVRNSGFTTVREADIRRQISFTFPGRQVKEFAVTDCRKVTRQLIQPPGWQHTSIVENRIYLPRFPMKRRASFKLLVLLSGTDRGIVGKGRLRRGSVVRRRPAAAGGLDGVRPGRHEDREGGREHMPGRVHLGERDRHVQRPQRGEQ
jgi:hypothetical protein